VGKYVETKRLKQLIRDYRRTGSVSDELGLVLIQIANGLCRKLISGNPEFDDIQSQSVLNLLHALDRVKLSGNPFNYLSGCVHITKPLQQAYVPP